MDEEVVKEKVPESIIMTLRVLTHDVHTNSLQYGLTGRLRLGQSTFEKITRYCPVLASIFCLRLNIRVYWPTSVGANGVEVKILFTDSVFVFR